MLASATGSSDPPAAATAQVRTRTAISAGRARRAGASMRITPQGSMTTRALSGAQKSATQRSIAPRARCRRRALKPSLSVMRPNASSSPRAARSRVRSKAGC
jgi:hypothetical protein